MPHRCRSELSDRSTTAAHQRARTIAPDSALGGVQPSLARLRCVISTDREVSAQSRRYARAWQLRGHQPGRAEQADLGASAARAKLAHADERLLAKWRRSEVKLLVKAAGNAVFAGRACGIFPVHVRDIQVVIDAPQLRWNAAKRRLAAAVQEIHDQYRVICRAEGNAVGDEEHRGAVIVNGYR